MRLFRKFAGRNRRFGGCERLEERRLLAADLSMLPQAEPFADVQDFGSSRDWFINAVNAPEVWAHGYTGQEVVVAVIDSGIDYDHSDLDDNIWRNEGEIASNGIDDDENGYVDDLYGWDFFDFDNDPMDESDHGTHVAGTIAAEHGGGAATGIAHHATVMPLRVLGGEDGGGDQSDVRRAIYYAVDNGADIINVSIAGGGVSRRMEQAIRYAQANNVLIVAAAGNEDGGDTNYPAAYSRIFANVIAVGAHDRNQKVATFSNLVGSSRAIQVEAPGVGIFSTNMHERYANFSGTSMATSVVSAVAALALSANPKLTPNLLRQFIVDGTDRDIMGADSEGGVNAALTVAFAVESVAHKRPVLPGDIDGNGRTEFDDFLILSANFGESNMERDDGDLDADGKVTFADFLIFAKALSDPGK